MNLHSIRTVYFVGIKGVAMAALAIYCKERGMNVRGCDTEEKFPTDEELRKTKVPVDIGFDSMLLAKKTDLVIYTGAHGGRDNPVVRFAFDRGIPTLSHGKALGMFMEGKRQITVVGSHGKTTTAGMIATTLKVKGKDPSYAIGCGALLGMGPAGHFGSGDFFVAEGDEYVTDHGHDETPRFLWQKPEVMVATNIDFDHPDAYPTLKSVQDAFVGLQKQQVGQKLTVVNIDDPKSKVLLSGQNVITYGFSPRADMHITHIGVGVGRMFFTLEQKRVRAGEFTLKVPGRHNVANAVAAIVTCQALGLNIDEIHNGLLAFSGTKRRFEKLGEVEGVTYYDDYAHHPAEIIATLAGAKKWYPHRRIIAVFQPHTFSRTKALLPDFARAFTDAAMVILTDIYASAREHDTLGTEGKTLLEETLKHHGDVRYGKDFLEVRKILSEKIMPGDVVIFMGAGDIYTWGRKIVYSA
ncbi:UDP-N-acetylmuramate--L-alanine ligase [Candidatus Gottesmanbacteria bacterium]|nr:UDP-N-acetylmuramate--L-alanine ligase [Candidatus Gottesmanbacteria bacterium]